MKSLVFILLLIVIYYFGGALGLLMQCEQIKALNQVKRFVWYIPFLKLQFIYERLKKGRVLDKIHFLVSYFRMREKSFVFICCMAICLEELCEEEKVKSKTTSEQRRQCILNAKLKMETYYDCVPA